jgi:ethanolamine permease
MRLRRREPQLKRPFSVPFYPLFPITALVIAVVSLIAIVYYNAQVAALFAALCVVGAGATYWQTRRNSGVERDTMLRPEEGSLP